MRINYGLLLLIIIVLLPVWSYIFWYYQKPTHLNLLILDKTVSEPMRNEHRSFNWLLLHLKYIKKNNELYDVSKDYFGFYPLENKKYNINDLDQFTPQQIDSMGKTLDMIYYTDLYGVYYNEWYLDKYETEHSPKIYGGMSYNDFLLLKKMKENHKLIVGEFNNIQSPTPHNLRREYEKMFDMKWTGWTVRYFDLLDTLKNPELPRWVIRLYKEQYGGNWPFRRAGIVFVHEDETIVILEKRTDLKIEVPYIYSSPYGMKKYGLPSKIHYPYWIDILKTGKTNRIVAMYKIKPNAIGDSLMRIHGIPKQFPAVLEHLGTDYRYYYFAGDYADNPIPTQTAYLAGITAVSRSFYKNSLLYERVKFFWKFYRPLMTTILKENFPLKKQVIPTP